MKDNKISSISAASFALGIFTLVVWIVPYLGYIPSLLSVIFGVLELSNYKDSKNPKSKILAVLGMSFGLVYLIPFSIGYFFG